MIKSAARSFRKSRRRKRRENRGSHGCFDCNIYLQAAVRDTGPAFACLSAAEPYINLAIATGAHFLVSRDKDLLELSNYDSADEKNLLKLSPSLQVLDPVALLRRLM